jgi:hypothetical protein
MSERVEHSILKHHFINEMKLFLNNEENDINKLKQFIWNGLNT